MLQDLRFTLRSLVAQPSFALIAIATLALGIGATAAIFTAVNAVLLRGLPFHEPGELYSLHTEMTDGRATGGQVSLVELKRLNASPEVVQKASGAFRYELSIVDGAGVPIKALGYGVVEGFFHVFGVPLALGRGFIAEEHVPGGPDAIVLSYRAWQTMFGGRHDVLGTSVRVEGGTNTVVGVAAQGFNFPSGADAWFALKLPPQLTGHIIDGYVRVADGIDATRLRAALGPISRSLQEEFPGANTNRILAVQPLRDAIVGPLQSTLLVVFAAAGLLLLIACVNVTSLLMSRGVVRSREIALRVAIGAQRGRILRQLLTESTVLAAIGAAAGSIVAIAGLALLLRSGASILPRVEEIGIDPAVLTFGIAATLATGLVVGLGPALRLVRTDLRGLMNEGARGSSGGPATHRMLHALVVAEVALAVVLTAGAALLVASFRNLQNTDGGFRAEGRLVFDLTLPMTTYRDYDQVADWYARLLDRLRALPGVTSAGATSTVPLAPELDFMTSFWFEDQGQPPAEERPRAWRRTVSPDLFSALGVGLVEGRGFTEFDRRDTPGACVVDETFVRRYAEGRSPIGRRIATRTNPAPVSNPLGIVRPATCEIVGVVRGVKFAGMGVDPEPAFHFPLDQATGRRQGIVLATSLPDPRGLIESVRAALRELDPLVSTEFHVMSALVARSLLRERLSMTMVMLFGLGALVLAAIGIYGVMAYSVSQREGEFAVRAALGAQPSDLRALVLRQGLTVGTIGVAAGVAIALLAGRFVQSQLYGVTASDPVTVIAVAVVMLLVVAGSTLIPAIRASNVSASRMLRG